MGRPYSGWWLVSALVRAVESPTKMRHRPKRIRLTSREVRSQISDPLARTTHACASQQQAKQPSCAAAQSRRRAVLTATSAGCACIVGSSRRRAVVAAPGRVGRAGVALHAPPRLRASAVAYYGTTGLETRSATRPSATASRAALDPFLHAGELAARVRCCSSRRRAVVAACACVGRAGVALHAPSTPLRASVPSSPPALRQTTVRGRATADSTHTL